MAAELLPKLAALEGNQEALLCFISQHAEVIDELYENELITEEAMDSFEPSMVLQAVCNAVKEDIRNFDRFCAILGPDSEIVTLLKRDRERFTEEEESQKILLDAGEEAPISSLMDDTLLSESVHAHKLRCQLQHIRDLPVTGEKAGESKAQLAKDLIPPFLHMSLQSNVDPTEVREQLSGLNQAQLLDDQVFLWALREIDEFSKDFAVQKMVAENTSTKPDLKLLLPDVVLNASMCAYAVNVCEPNTFLSFFNDDVHSHSLEEVSLSRPSPQGDVPKYLIGRQGTTCYVAFPDSCDLSWWMHTCKSFEEGIEDLSGRIPLYYFVEQLFEGVSVVLTGFSFGGVIAMAIAAKIWDLPHASMQNLHRLKCITFGQPQISMTLVEQVVNRFPEFVDSVHALYLENDALPRVMALLDRPYEQQSDPVSLPDLLHGGATNQDVQGPICTLIMQQLVTLQNPTHFSSPGEIMSTPDTLSSALRKLKAILLQASKARTILPDQQSYSKCYHIALPELKEVNSPECSHLSDEAIEELDLSLFEKHQSGLYLDKVAQMCAGEDGCPNPPEPRNPVTEADFMKPLVQFLEYHHYDDLDSILIRGENLWFLHQVRIARNLLTQPRDVNSNLVQFSCPLTAAIPPQLSSSSEASASADVEAFSHFSDPVSCSVPVSHKVNSSVCNQTLLILQKLFTGKTTDRHMNKTDLLMFCCIVDHEVEFMIRDVQEKHFARFGPSVLIELAFFCALLERTPHNPDKELSRRFKFVKSFLEEITRVAPFESLHSAMAYSDNEELVGLCEQLGDALADSKIPPSLSMWRNSVLYKLRQETDSETIHEYLLGALDLVEMIFVSIVQFGNVLNVEAAEYLFKVVLFVYWGDDEDVYKIIKKPSKDMPIYFSNDYYGHLCDISETGFPLAAISSVNLQYLFSMFPEFAPLEILKEGCEELTQSQTHSLFSLQEKKVQLSMVTSIIVAFMQEHIRVPLVDNVASLWKLSKLYVQLLPRFIKFCGSIWKMRDDGPDDFEAELLKLLKPMADCVQKLYDTSTLMVDSYVTRLQLLVTGVGNASCLSEQCKEYFLEAQLVHTCQQLTITVATPTETILSKWDKLFKRTTLSSVAKSFRPLLARWIRWSLMIHNLRHELVKYTAVGVVGLVNSGKSQLVKKLFQINEFRNLVPHCYTLGNRLFPVQTQSGTTAGMRTTVPFIYNLGPHVEGLDVIDFPGADDDQKEIQDLVTFLYVLAQMFVFVVDYRKVHTGEGVEWLKRFEGSSSKSVPLLVCLTFGDRLFVECREDQGGYHPEHMKKAIATELKIIQEKIEAKAGPSKFRHIKFFSFSLDNDSNLKTAENQQRLKEVGVHGVQDVGDWIVETLRTRFSMDNVADQLYHFVR